MLLISAVWLRSRAKERRPLVRRQELPAEAWVMEADLERFVEEMESEVSACQEWEMFFPPVVVVSHMWLQPGHPDPLGRQLFERLGPTIDWYLAERAKRRGIDDLSTVSPGDDADFGVFYDYCRCAR